MGYDNSVLNKNEGGSFPLCKKMYLGGCKQNYPPSLAKITLFAQVIQKLPKDWIKSLVRKHGTDKHAKGFNTWSHLVSMIFCQFAYGRHSSQYCCSLSSSGRLHTNGTSRTSLHHLGSTPLLKLISTSGLMSLSPHRLKRKMTHRGVCAVFGIWENIKSHRFDAT